MVRFHWHVEDGLGASVGPGQLVYLRDYGVLQAMVEIEMPGRAGYLDACMTIPQNYNTDTGVKELGIVFAHGEDASDWRGRLLSEVVVTLARAGYLVMRYICPHNAHSEAARVAAFEKAADAAATSPYARGVTRWLLAGIGSGARLAAEASGRVRSCVAGQILMSYPLREEMPPADCGGAPPAPDSSGPLLGLAGPVLFLTASSDALVSEAALVEVAPRLAAQDVRSFVVQDVDSHFLTLNGKGPHVNTLRTVNAILLDFVNSVAAYRMDLCKLPRVWRGTAAAQAAGEGGEGKAAGGAPERPPLQRPACFRPIPTGPPPQQPQQQQPAAAALQPALLGQAIQVLPYGLNATTAQALAAQLQQRGALGGTGGGAAATAQQLLLQQAAAAAAAAAQRRAADGSAEPSAAQQLAAALVRSGAAGGSQQAQLLQLLPAAAAGGGVSAETLTSVLMQRLAAQQQAQQQQQQGQGLATHGSLPQGSLVALPSGQLLAAATLLKQQQQAAQQHQQQQGQQPLQLQLQAAAGGGSTAGAMTQQQQLQLLLQRQQLLAQQQLLQRQLLGGGQDAAAAAAALQQQQQALAGALGQGGVLMLQAQAQGQGSAAGAAAGDGGDVHMVDS